MESIIIGQIGGGIGVVIGILVGNIIASIMKVSFVIPWIWILLAFVLCLLISMISGYLPAKKASKVDPIEAIRYE